MAVSLWRAVSLGVVSALIDHSCHQVSSHQKLIHAHKLQALSTSSSEIALQTLFPPPTCHSPAFLFRGTQEEWKRVETEMKAGNEVEGGGPLSLSNKSVD